MEYLLDAREIQKETELRDRDDIPLLLEGKKQF
jgi:hypothetical protein